MQADLFTLERVTLRPARLRDVSFTIRRGITAVLGPSGAGKTSLLNVLAGFEKPASGKLTGDTRVAWAPQDDALWPGCTAREHLTECGAAVAAADSLLASFDLANRADAKPRTLSRGERNRLALARALAMTPRTLVLDEPLAHTDTARSGKFWSVLREHVRRTGASLIFATHSPEIALAEAENAICLRDGAVRFTGSIAELYESPASPELADFLGPSNWFTPEEARPWFGATWSAPRCVRPERLSICTAEGSGTLVVKSRFLGAYAETEVRAPDGTARTFIHRPALPPAPGAHVCIQFEGAPFPELAR